MLECHRLWQCMLHGSHAIWAFGVLFKTFAVCMLMPFAGSTKFMAYGVMSYVDICIPHRLTIERLCMDWCRSFPIGQDECYGTIKAARKKGWLEADCYKLECPDCLLWPWQWWSGCPPLILLRQRNCYSYGTNKSSPALLRLRLQAIKGVAF